MRTPQLVFVQISDLHFAVQDAGTHYDGEVDVRRELLRDLTELRSRLPAISGILVCGDLAYSGKESEYEIAGQWLEHLCEVAGCEVSNVWVIPGNHDVNRSALSGSWVLEQLRTKLRSIPPHQIDGELRRFVSEKTARQLLLTPLENYNRFAERYGCSIDPQRVAWTHDFALGADYTLRLWGLTSTLVSDQYDDDGANRLVLGTMQVQFPVQDCVVHAVMCHHPPQWLRDQDSIEDFLHTRASIQLYGHKHRQRIQHVHREGEHCIQVFSGALHPERDESTWEPRYNVLQLGIDESAQPASVTFVLYPRVWRQAATRFVADFGAATEGESMRFDLPLRTPAGKPCGEQKPGPSEGPQPRGGLVPDLLHPAASAGVLEGPMQRRRQLTYRFLSLPYTQQIDIAQRLGLLDDSDHGLEEAELHRRFFARAVERNLLEELCSEVNRRYSDLSGEE